jgi:hypothetical protein
MQVPLQVSFRHMQPSEAIETLIREKATALDTFSEHIMSCHVLVEAAEGNHARGSRYNICIEITAPDEDMVITCESAQRTRLQDMDMALRDAFDCARRKLEEYLPPRHVDATVRTPDAVGST